MIEVFRTSVGRPGGGEPFIDGPQRIHTYPLIARVQDFHKLKFLGSIPTFCPRGRVPASSPPEGSDSKNEFI